MGINDTAQGINPGGGGGVVSVNGDFGPAVVLTAADVGAVDAAGAIAAVQADRGFDFDQYFVPLVINTPVPQTYRLVTTPALVAGTYKISLVLRLEGSAGGTDLEIDVQIDGVSLGAVLTEAVVPGGGFLFSGTLPTVWAAGVHTVEFLVAQPNSPGFITVTLSSALWIKELPL